MWLMRARSLVPWLAASIARFFSSCCSRFDGSAFACLTLAVDDANGGMAAAAVCGAASAEQLPYLEMGMPGRRVAAVAMLALVSGAAAALHGVDASLRPTPLEAQPLDAGQAAPAEDAHVPGRLLSGLESQLDTNWQMPPEMRGLGAQELLSLGETSRPSLAQPLECECEKVKCDCIKRCECKLPSGPAALLQLQEMLVPVGEPAMLQMETATGIINQARAPRHSAHTLPAPPHDAPPRRRRSSTAIAIASNVTA